MILKKIFGRVDHTIRQTLERHHGTAVNFASGEKPSVWGVGKDVSKFALRHKFFLPYIPPLINTLVDFGCGSGLDLQGMKSITEVNRAICADVIDERDASARENPFVLIAPGSILPFANETIDMYMIFHVLHHMNIDLVNPIKDIVRTLVPGGLVLIKDHDVSTAVQASNVDFEHLAYAVSADTGNLDQMMRNYGTIEPMTYYTAKEIISMFESAGCVLLKSEIITPRTYIYGAIFQKNARSH
jgi:SAM-dependent methyltransferase